MERIEMSERSLLLAQGEDNATGAQRPEDTPRRPFNLFATVVERKASAQRNARPKWTEIRKWSKFDDPLDLLHCLAKNDLRRLSAIPPNGILKRRLGSERTTPLIIASYACSEEVVKALLDSGVDVNERDAAGRLPLLVAAVCRRNDVVSELLKRGANPNLDNSGRYRESSAREDLKWYEVEDRYMKENNMELPNWEQRGRRALHFAVESNSQQCVESLLENGADADTKDDSGVTPLLLAGEKVEPEDSQGVDAYEKIVKCLIDRGVKATHVSTGRIPVIKAAQLGSAKCLRELLCRGADPNTRSEDYKTALHLAAERASMSVEADPRCVSVLLSHGADLSAEDSEFVSPLRAIIVGVTKPMSFFSRVLDDQITLEGEDDGSKENVKVNYHAMIPKGKSGQEDILHALLEEEYISKWLRHKIFRHAYIMSFVHAKWETLRYFFFFYIGMYIVHVICLSVFATLAHGDLFHFVDEEMKRHVMQKVIPWSRSVVIITSVLVLVNAVVMCYVFRKRFAFSSEMFRIMIESIMSLVVCIMTFFDGDLFNVGRGVTGYNFTNQSLSNVEIEENFLTTIGFDSETLSSPEEKDYTTMLYSFVLHGTSLAIFLTWLELMLLVGRLPWASDALLFTAVLKNVLRALFTYGFMIVGFAFVFFLEFRFLERESFGDPWRSLVKTVVMMMGEFDYNGLFSGDKGGIVGYDTFVIGRIVFVCFVVLVPIALMNLMLGLAVSDTRDLDAESSDRQLLKLAECVVHWEFVVRALERMCYSFTWMRKSRTIELEYSFPTSLNKVVFPIDVMRSLFFIANNNRKDVRGRKSKLNSNARKTDQFATQQSQDSSRRYDLNYPMDSAQVMDQMRIITDDLKELKRSVEAIREIVEEQFCSDRKPHFQHYLPVKGAKWNQKSFKNFSGIRIWEGNERTDL